MDFANFYFCCYHWFPKMFSDENDPQRERRQLYLKAHVNEF